MEKFKPTQQEKINQEKLIEQQKNLEIAPEAEALRNIEDNKQDLIEAVSKIEVSNIEQREALDILEHELLVLTRELKESISFAQEIFSPQAKEEQNELNLYLFDIASKWVKLEDIKKEFFLLDSEKQDTEQKISKLEQLRELTLEDKTITKLEQEIDLLQNQTEPQERIYSQVRGSDFIPEEIKNKALENIESIGKSIDELKLPGIEPSKDPKEVFQITKQGALLSEDMSNTYRLVLQEAPKRWAEKTEKFIEKLKEKEITKKLAEFMENFRLPRRISEVSMAGAMILMGGYLLGGCTRVDHKEEEEESPIEKIERQQFYSLIEKTIYSGKIQDTKIAFTGLKIENGELDCRVVPLDDINSCWSSEATESKMFNRIKSYEFSSFGLSEIGKGSVIEDIKDWRPNYKQTGQVSINQFLAKSEQIAKEMGITLESANPKQIIEVATTTVAKELTYNDSILYKIRDIEDILKSSIGVCEDYSALTEFVCNFLIKKYNIPNLHIENILSKGQEHAFNIVYVVDEEGDLTLSFFDPTWIDSETGELNFAKLNAFDLEHVEIFNPKTLEEMYGILHYLREPRTDLDWTYINTAVQVMWKIIEKTDKTGSTKYLKNEGQLEKIENAKQILKVFTKDEYDKNADDKVICKNFLATTIKNELKKAEDSEYRELFGKKYLDKTKAPEREEYHYEIAWQFYKIAKEQNIEFDENYQDQIPPKFRH